MKKFRLKKVAVPFFKEKYSTEIKSFDYWDKIGIDLKALEEVEDAYITYGHQSFDKNSTSLSGWSFDDKNASDKGSHFHFTLNFPSTKHREHDKFNNGRTLRKLMDTIQNDVNDFYSQFVNEEIDKVE